MPSHTTGEPSRRDILTGRAICVEAERAGGALADAIADAVPERVIPRSGPTVRVETRAMACTFSVVMNPGPPKQVMTASDALDMIHELEAQMTVYRDASEMSAINRKAAAAPVTVEPTLFELLKQARDISRQTDGAFDPTAGSLIALWRRCRDEGRIPRQEELDAALAVTGMQHVAFDDAARTISFDREGVSLNLGAIGKGAALDRIAQFLEREELENWLFHGGYSSVLVQGEHDVYDGWPVGLRNPLLPHGRLATILLRNQALSTSGSNVQNYRHAGKRYGHIIDPRTGQPSDDLLSVTVVAPTAAEADALSTAFFVAGVEKSLAYCDNHPQIGTLLIRPPERGRTLDVLVRGIRADDLFFESDVNPEFLDRE